MKKLNLIIVLFFLATSHLSSAVYLEPSPHFKPRMDISAVYIEHNGNILLIHRQNTKSEGNKWGIPGGKVEKHETPLQAAIRETKEETGYDISKQPIENLGTLFIEYDEKKHINYHMFRTQLCDKPEAVKINFNEHKGFTWMTPAESLKMDLMQEEGPCFKLVYFPEST